MAQAIHLLVLAGLAGSIAAATLWAWLTFAFSTSRRERTKALGVWIALVIVFVLVLYNPLLLPNMLGAVPLPPNPFKVS